MDGTLADIRHRLHHVSGSGKKNWKRFFREMDRDLPNEEIVTMVRELQPGHEIVVVSGRPDDYRTMTEEWLRRHDVHWDEMHMRRSGDHRPDHIVKREILDRLLASGKRITLVIDDRPSVCEMWRAAGLNVHQVKSDFWDENRT